jgi:hypothetical protein
MLGDKDGISLMTTYKGRATISDLIENEKDNYAKEELLSLLEENPKMLGSRFLGKIIQKMYRTHTAWTDHDNWRESMPVPFPDNHSDWVEHHSD